MEKDIIYNQDCKEVMKSLPNESIDLICTDPPYKVTKKGCYGTMSGYWATDRANNGMIFSHNDIDIEEYLPEFYRVLKADTHCYIMCNNLNLPHFFDVIGKSHFHFVKLLVWDKQSKICGRYYMGQIEHIFMLRKGKDKQINNCSQSDLLSYPNKKEKDKLGNNLHDCEKPINLFQTLIECSSKQGDVVLDPFAGIGTAALACLRSKRKYICIEKDDRYFKIAEQRVKIELQSQTLF